jgi:phage portal protein BeeE
VEPSVDVFKDYITRGKLEQKFLSNGAMPSGILSREDEVGDEADWKKIKAWWQREYEGERNAGKTAFLQGKWTYTKLGLTQGEMQAIEKEKWSISQIFINHGVPLSIAGLEKAANYATSKQDDVNFRSNEIVPLLDILVGKLNATGPEGMGVFIKAFSPAWVMSYQLSGLINVEQVVKEYKPLADCGAITLNELRVLCGLEEKDNPLLDQHFVPSGRIPIEMAGLTGTTPGNSPDEPPEPKEPAEPKEPEE